MLVRLLIASTVLVTAATLVPAAGSAVSSPAAASSRVGLSLNPAVGPPTTLTKVKGPGFASREVVAFYFDGVRVGSDVANPNGAFNGRLLVPAAARPGDHVVEAVGQASGLVSRAVFLVRTDWLQGCFNGGRSCFNPYENVFGPATVGALGVAWRADVGTDGSSSPVYANGKLFVGTRDGLVALDPATGGIIINYRSGPVSTTPAVVRGFDPQPDPPGKVVFGSSDGVLHAVSTAGGELWHVGLGAVPSSPLVIQAIGDLSVRIVVGAGNTLFAFDGEGNRLWASVLEGGDISKAAAALVSPPEPDRVIVAAGSTLYALDAATGQIVWATTPSGARLGAPAAGNPGVPHVPHILIGDDGGRLYSVDPSTGAVLSTSIGRAAVVASPAIANPTLSIDACIYWGDRGGIFSAADQTDDFPPPEWQVALGGPVDGPPVLANGVIYVGTDPEEGDPHIFALDQANGRVLFSDRLPGGIASSPIVADGRLVVATESGDVLAYDGPDS